MALDYCSGTSQSSGEGAEGMVDRTGDTPARVPAVASYPMSAVWPKGKTVVKKLCVQVSMALSIH